MGKSLRVPYEKGGFTVKDLPPGIDFKKPSSYGKKQIELIMAAREKITFEVLPGSTNQCDDGNVADSETGIREDKLPPNQDLITSTLSALVGEGIAKLASKTTPIDEKDVEVENLSLDQDQRLTLYASCRSFFTCDAWLAIGGNIKWEEPQMPGIILSTYTGEHEDQDYWLFYTEEKLRKIKSISPNATIGGLWLDLKKDTTDDSLIYRVLPQCHKIYGKNIIKSEHGPLYYFHHFDISTSPQVTEQLFTMPKLLHHAIISILTLSGIISSDN